MPCSPRKARKLLKRGKAKIVKYEPFTIKLLNGSSGYKQPCVLGIDSGYENIGIAVTTQQGVVIFMQSFLIPGGAIVAESDKERQGIENLSILLPALIRRAKKPTTFSREKKAGSLQVS